MGRPQPALAPRVLVAIARNNRRRIALMLRGWNVEHVETSSELARALGERPYDLVIVGAHFDESKAIEALKAALVHAQGIPVVCVFAGRFRSSLGGGTLQALRLATEALGAAHFLDLDSFGDDAAGHARVRALLERLFANAGK
jgi:hypothetical protein